MVNYMWARRPCAFPGRVRTISSSAINFPKNVGLLVMSAIPLIKGTGKGDKLCCGGLRTPHHRLFPEGSVDHRM
jgi:hypothetical protein